MMAHDADASWLFQQQQLARPVHNSNANGEIGTSYIDWGACLCRQWLISPQAL